MNMKAIVTIIGKDTVGIIAKISTVLAEEKVNILDINQTVMREYFTMIMLVDLERIKIGFDDLQKKLFLTGQEIGMTVRIQHEEVFSKMHEI